MARKVNKHGLKINGLKKVSGETKWILTGMNVECFYNIETGETWAVNQIVTSWTVYKDPAIIGVATYYREKTMQQIADDIAEAVSVKW